MSIKPTKEAIERFISTTKFSGYQSVPLPFGLKVPGIDHSSKADTVFGSCLNGKTILDVGTYYGFFLYEAIKRGALKAVGIEADPERYIIAKQIAELNDNRYSVLLGRVEELHLKEQFDVVLFLNVLHHVLDPISAICRLTELCRDTLIVEFCLVDDPDYICFLYNKSEPPTFINKIRARIQSLMLRIVANKLPLMAVGNQVYHRTFYFNCQAFYNLFVTHYNLFDDITFLPSSTKRRAIAFCKVSKKTAKPHQCR